MPVEADVAATMLVKILAGERSTEFGRPLTEDELILWKRIEVDASAIPAGMIVEIPNEMPDAPDQSKWSPGFADRIAGPNARPALPPT